MAAPTIVWNGNTITLSRPFTSWVHTIKTDTIWRMSISGYKRSHHRKYLWNCSMEYRNLTVTQEQELLSWWSWAQSGGHYAIAKDGSKTLNTRVTVAASAAQADITLAAVTGAAAGDALILTKADRSYYEIVVVQSVVGTTVTCTGNLKRAFAVDDNCRHLYYYPRVVAKDNKYPLDVDGEGSTNLVGFKHTAEEDLG